MRFGFRVMGYMGRMEFFTKSQENLNLWFNSLKKVGILLHISTEYKFDKAIGKGNFAKVGASKYQINRSI